jgi:hypothetical protein
MLLVDFLKGADRVLADKGKTTPGCRLPDCILLTGSPYWFFRHDLFRHFFFFIHLSGAVDPAGISPDFPQVSPCKNKGEPAKNVPLPGSSQHTMNRAIGQIFGKPLPEFPASYEFNNTHNHHFFKVGERVVPEGKRRSIRQPLAKTGQISLPSSFIQVTDQEVMA